MNHKNSMDIEHASEYDELARKYHWHGPELLFGFCFEYIQPKQKLLDLGIGTGFSSSLFFKFGLEIYGIDNSIEMLNICESKGITKDLKRWDLLRLPLPYSDASFHCVIAAGVFHFWGDLEPIIREISRLVVPNGIFAFTVKTIAPEKQYSGHRSKDFYSEKSSEGIPIFTHNDTYIGKLLKLSSFKKLKELKFYVFSGEGEEMLFKVFLVRKN